MNLWERLLMAYPKTRMGVLTFMAIFGFCGSVIAGNGEVLFIGLFLGLFTTVIWVVCAFSSESIRNFKLNFPDFTNGCAYVSLVCWPLLLCISLSGFYFGGSDKIWVVDQEVKTDAGAHFAVPILQDIRSIASRQDIGVLVVATTKDKIQVQGHVQAKLRLVSDEATILRAVNLFVHGDRQMQRELEVLLEYSFRDVIAQHDLDDLQNNLVLEWQTGNRVLEQTLTAFGIKWEGTLEVTDLHAYFGRKNQKSVL